MDDVTPTTTVEFNLPTYLDKMEARIVTVMDSGFREMKEAQQEHHRRMDKLELQVVDLKSFNNWLVRGGAGAGTVIGGIIVATYEKWKSLLGL